MVDESRGLLLSMVCDDDPINRSFGVLFIKPRAFRKREEIYCTVWHIEDAYDTVCEIQGSDWVDELRAAATPDKRDYWVMRHFMIYVDSFGCLEVVAESVLLDENTET
ncbi:hypothetical protein D5041_13295 [Verminephrobacter aporrectodeae subsp. tuberculatae]|nr:hypothetical protein [Verminephrobacter aporrectodeae subsp. tuberculatae]MCW5289981.1 hypothetical protein [Verminephrobacter aporrectodeae subsp. tuberculatae]